MFQLTKNRIGELCPSRSHEATLNDGRNIKRLPQFFIRILILGVCLYASLLRLPSICRAEDIRSPDGTQVISSSVGNIDEPESATFAQLKRNGKVVWSNTFRGKAVEYLWSPSSLYLLIYVEHVDSPEGLFVLNTNDRPHLFNLDLDRIHASIGKTLLPADKMLFGFRSGIEDDAWINPHECHFVYLYQEFDTAAVAQLVLMSDKNPPVLKIETIIPAKDETDLNQILARVHAGSGS